MRSYVPLAEPDFHTHPDWSVTLGPEVAEVATLAGIPPYPEQQLVLNDLFALDPAEPNRSAVFEQAAIAARQQMKTGFLKQAALGWLYVMPQPLVIWSAHEFGTAQEAFRDMQALIASSPDLDRRVQKIRTAAGSESIEMKDGSRLRFKARTSGGGRGLTGSKVILDEAFALDGAMMGALLPTLISVPDPQVVYASSAGLAKSGILRGVRDRGRAGADRMGYAEWLAEKRECASKVCDHTVGTPGCALDDKDLWRKACPISARKDPEAMQAIANLRMALPPDEFMRECLGWWDEPLGDSIIGEGLWTNLLAEDSTIDRATFALDVSPERDWASIVVAGVNQYGRTHIEITSRDGVLDHRPGTNWVRDRLVQLAADRGGLAVNIAAGSAAESLAPDLDNAGIRVERIAMRDVVSACGRFYDLAINEQLSHLVQDDLTNAVIGARKKNLGERAFMWVRTGSVGDITPLYAATLAVWAVDTALDPVLNVW